MRYFGCLFFSVLFFPFASLAQGPQPIQLTNTKAMRLAPFAISGDGKRVFYHSSGAGYYSNPRRGTIYLRRHDSDVPEILLEDVEPNWMLADHKGERLFFGMDFDSREGPDYGNSTIYSLEIATGRTTKLLSRPLYFERVVWAEAAQKLILAQFDGHLWDLSVSEPAALTSLGWAPASVIGLWTDPASKELYLGIDNEQRGVWRFERSTGTTTKVFSLPPGGAFWHIAVTPDRSRIWTGGNQWGIHRYRADTGAVEEFFPGGRILATTPDASRILVETRADPFGANTDGSPEIFVVNAVGQVIRQITSGARDSAWTDITTPNPAFLNEDGSRYVIVQNRRNDDDGYGQQWLMLGGDHQAGMTALECGGESYTSLLHVLADSPHLIYAVSGPPNPGVWQARLDGSGAKRLDFAYSGTFSPNATAVTSLRIETDASLTLLVHPVSTPKPIEWPTGLYAVYSHLPNDYWPQIPISGLRVDDKGRFVVLETTERLGPNDSGSPPFVYALDFRDSVPVVRYLGRGSSPQISADGTRVVFNRNVDNISSTVTLDTRDWQSKELDCAVEDLSADGKWLVGREGEEIVWRTASDGQATFRTNIDVPNLSSVQVSSDGEVAAGTVVRTEDNSHFVVAYSREGGRLGVVDLPENSQYYGGFLSGDGRYELYACPCQGPENPDAQNQVFAASIGPSTAWAALPGQSSEVTGLSLVNRSSEPIEVQVSSYGDDGQPGSQWTVPLEAENQRAEVVDPGAGAPQVSSMGMVSPLSTSGVIVTAGQDLKTLESTPLARLAHKELMIPLLPVDGVVRREQIILLNPNSAHTVVTTHIQLGFLTSTKSLTLPPHGRVSLDPRVELRAGSSATLLRLSASLPVIAGYRVEETSANLTSRFGISAVEPATAASRLVFPFAATIAPFRSTLVLMNAAATAMRVRVAMSDSNGLEDADSVQIVSVKPRGVTLVDTTGALVGQLHADAVDDAKFAGTLIVRNVEAGSAFTEPETLAVGPSIVVPYFAQTEDFFTAFSVVNPHPVPVRYTAVVFNGQGETIAEKDLWLPAFGQEARLLTDVGTEAKGTGYFIIRPGRPLYVTAVISTVDGASVAQLLSP